MHIFLLLGLAISALAVDPTNQVCSVKLPTGDAKSDILVNNLKLKEPKHSPSQGDKVMFECETGFLAEDLKGKSASLSCSKGVYNGVYQYEDLLCKSDFHKSVKVKKIRWDDLKSGVFECSNSGWAVYEVSRETASGEKPLYRVCLDTNVMRTKFAYRLASPEKIEIKHQTREDVWGFDSYGKTTEERLKLSQGYVRKNQQRRTTNAYSHKYNQGKTYPYYFNRGHLVAFTDFTDPEDSKATVLYLNAAPQWDLLNKHSWSTVERQIRTLIKNDPANWEIYTGTYGNIQTPKGLLYLAPLFKKDGSFLKGQLPVPLTFWKIAHNLVDKSKSRAYVGVNNPELRTVEEISQPYRLCNPIGKIEGNDNFGFTYQCPVSELINKLKSENIVLKNVQY